MRRVLSLLALSLAAGSVSGCASLWKGTIRSYSAAPSGLPWGEELVRRSLAMGSFEQALSHTASGKDGAPDDELLRSLFRGQTAFYAGRYAESAEAFAEADRLTEERYTKSASRGALSLLTNDHALRYSPTRTERLFSRYYAMLGRVESGDMSGASVEARRLSSLLEELAPDLDASERALHAALREVAGAVFESAGELNDAGVAYRNAALLRGASRSAIDSMHLVAPQGDSAAIVLIVERGFVAHYVSQSLAIPLDGDDRERVLHSSEVSRRTRDRVRPQNEQLGKILGPRYATQQDRLRGSLDPVSERPRIPSSSAPTVTPAVNLGLERDTVGRVTTSAASEWLSALDALPDGGVFINEIEEQVNDLDSSGVRAAESVASDWTPRRARGTRYLGDRTWNRTWMTVSWPGLVRSRLPVAPLSLVVSGLTPAVADSGAAVFSGDSAVYGNSGWTHRFDAGTLPSFTADVSDAVGSDARRQRVARIARLVTRTATRVAAVDALRDKHGEAAGAVAGLLVSAIERADTRSWHLLPGSISVVRITVPAGRVETSAVLGGRANGIGRELRELNAEAGSVHVMSTRVWRDPAGTVPATIAANAEPIALAKRNQ